MAQKKNKTKKTPKKQTARIVSAPKKRRVKLPRYKSFSLSKRVKVSNKKLPSAYKLLKKSLGIVKNNWKLFGGIALVYAFLNLILVHGFGQQTDFQSIKDTLQGAFSGKFSGISTSAVLFSYLISTGTTAASQAGSVYQPLLLILVSLVVIWSLRQVMAGEKITIRDGFYKGAYAVVPFILVLLVIGLQLIPLVVGSWLYGTITANAIAVTVLEKVVWALFCLLLAVLSLYMIASSLFALYIVTLPNMTPMKALRSARQLVLHRRWVVLAKIVFLLFALLVVAAAIFMPLVSLVPGAVEWIFFGLSATLPVVVNAYMYNLYRNLL